MVATISGSYLLVEDNPDHAELLRLSIEGLAPDVTLHHATDGIAALELLQQGPPGAPRPLRPDVILLDLKLPRLDGHQVLRTVKSDPELRHIPVVVLTTSDSRHDKRAAYQHHANSYLVKPIGFDKLQSLVAAITDYWGRTNLPPIRMGST